MLVFLVLFAIFTNGISSTHPSPHLATQSITLFYNNAVLITDRTPTNYEFVPSLSTSIPTNISQVYMVFNGFSLYNNKTVHFYVDYVVTNNTILFNTFNPVALYQVSFTMLITTPQTYPLLHLEVKKQSLTLTQCNSNSRSFWTNSQTVNILSALVYNPGITIFKTFISYYSAVNSNSFKHIGVQISELTPTSGDTIYPLKIDCMESTVINYLVIITFIYDKAIFNFNQQQQLYLQAPYVQNMGFGSSSKSLSSVLLNGTIPVAYGIPFYDRNCLFGLKQLIISNNGYKTMTLYFNSSQNSSTITQLTQIDNGQQIKANLGIFCFLQCDNITFYYTTTGQCEPCIIDANACYQSLVDRNVQGLGCIVNTVFDATLVKCKCSKGVLVKYGCTDITWCIAVSPTGSCLQCEFPKILGANNLSCICPGTQVLITGVCIDCIGCIAATMVDNIPFCVYADRSKHYNVTPSGTCGCVDGYQLINRTCYPLCGNGMKQIQQDCDDGNLIDGDGCSFNCKNQAFFVCTENAAKLSHCIYIGKIKINSISISRSLSQNKGIFVFTLSPTLKILNQIDWQSSIKFSCPNSHFGISKIQYSSNSLILKADYTTDMQDQIAQLNITFDGILITQRTISAQFQIISSNYQLRIAEGLDKILLYRTIIKYFSILPILIFIASVFTHKMIGIETIHTFQLVFFLNLFYDKQNIMSEMLKYLKYSNGYNEINVQIANRTNPMFLALDFNRYFYQNHLIISIVQLTLVGLVGIFFVRYLYRMTMAKQNQQEGTFVISQFCQSVIHKIFNVGLFPIAVGFFFQSFIVQMLDAYSKQLQSRTAGQIMQNSMLGLFLFISTTVIFCLQFFFSRVKNQYNWMKLPQCCTSYVPLYLFFTCCYLLCFYLVNLNKSIPLLMFITFNSINIVYLVFFPPYAEKLDNLSIIFNKFTVLIYAVHVQVYRLDSSLLSTNIDLIFIIILLILLSCVSALASIRLIRQIFQRIKSKKYFFEEQIWQHELQKKIELSRKYSINNSNIENELDEVDMRMNQLNPYRIQTQILKSNLLLQRQFNQKHNIFDRSLRSINSSVQINRLKISGVVDQDQQFIKHRDKAKKRFKEVKSNFIIQNKYNLKQMFMK